MTNAEYVAERDKLIQFATHHADSKCGSHAPHVGEQSAADWAIAWNLAYLGEMDRLAREHGIVR